MIAKSARGHFGLRCDGPMPGRRCGVAFWPRYIGEHPSVDQLRRGARPRFDYCQFYPSRFAEAS